jgi:SAM-dependent methyltransferase
VQLASEAARAENVPATFQLADFLSDAPPFQFDWLFEHTLFCAIQPEQRAKYVEAALRWLKPGGQYLAVNYLIPDKEGPPFGTNREEQWERFSPHFELVAEWVPRSYPNRTGLERMFWWKRLNA